MSTGSDPTSKPQSLLAASQRSFHEGYREGVLAERARVISICDRARNIFGNRIDEITTLANKILLAEDAIPAQEDHDGEWTVTKAAETLIRVSPEPEYSAPDRQRLANLQRKCERQQRTIEALHEELRSRLV